MMCMYVEWGGRKHCRFFFQRCAIIVDINTDVRVNNSFAVESCQLTSTTIGGDGGGGNGSMCKCTVNSWPCPGALAADASTLSPLDFPLPSPSLLVPCALPLASSLLKSLVVFSCATLLAWSALAWSVPATSGGGWGHVMRMVMRRSEPTSSGWRVR